MEKISQMKRYRLTYPFYGNTIYESKSFNKGIRSCYKEYRELCNVDDIFMVTELNSGITYQFKVNKKQIKQVGSSRFNNINKKLKLLEEQMKSMEKSATISDYKTEHQMPQTDREQHTESRQEQNNVNNELHQIMEKLNTINNRIMLLEKKVDKDKLIELQKGRDEAAIAVETLFLNRPDIIKTAKEYEQAIEKETNGNIGLEMLSIESPSASESVSYKDVQSKVIPKTRDDIYRENLKKLDLIEGTETKGDNKCIIM